MNKDRRTPVQVSCEALPPTGSNPQTGMANRINITVSVPDLEQTFTVNQPVNGSSRLILVFINRKLSVGLGVGIDRRVFSRRTNKSALLPLTGRCWTVRKRMRLSELAMGALLLLSLVMGYFTWLRSEGLEQTRPERDAAADRWLRLQWSLLFGVMYSCGEIGYDGQSKWRGRVSCFLL